MIRGVEVDRSKSHFFPSDKVKLTEMLKRTVMRARSIEIARIYRCETDVA